MHCGAIRIEEARQGKTASKSSKLTNFTP